MNEDLIHATVRTNHVIVIRMVIAGSNIQEVMVAVHTSVNIHQFTADKSLIEVIHSQELAVLTRINTLNALAGIAVRHIRDVAISSAVVLLRGNGLIGVVVFTITGHVPIIIQVNGQILMGNRALTIGKIRSSRDTDCIGPNNKAFRSIGLAVLHTNIIAGANRIGLAVRNIRQLEESVLIGCCRSDRRTVITGLIHLDLCTNQRRIAVHITSRDSAIHTDITVRDFIAGFAASTSAGTILRKGSRHSHIGFGHHERIFDIPGHRGALALLHGSHNTRCFL